VLDVALTLGEVLRQGVMHRDLKPDNIIIRDVNARPLLIDFGVGTLVGAPAVTRSRLPPGTLEFRAPEAWRFSQENDSEHYEYGPADELWALGVTFYWLLTDVLPFGDRDDEEDGGLAERILHQTPVAPHLLNPRVPRALSDICMRMLEKEPAARYSSVVEFCAALDAAMTEAEPDSCWDLPLFEPDALHDRTTEEDPARVDVNDSKRWLRRWMKEKRRRGLKPPEKTDTAPMPVAGVLAAVPEQNEPVVAPIPPPEPIAPPVSRTPDPCPALTRRRTRLATATGLTAVVLGISLLASSLLFPPVSAPPDTSSEATTTQQSESGHEVAWSAKPLDPPGGEGAEPEMGSISAPVMITMLPKDDTSEKPQEKKQKVLGRAAKVIGTGLVCKALAGCPTPQQVRPTPEPAACPAGSTEAMADKLGVRVGQTFSGYLSTKGGAQDITVRQGATSIELGPLALDKEGGDIFLSGTLTIGEERVYGQFTQARIRDGQPFPVCFEMRDIFKGGKGSAISERRGDPDSARIWSTVDLKAVDRFE
jgi:eukaryotic-like serine/threonine-protein kinase